MLSYERSAGGGLRMSEAAETAGDRPQPGIFQVNIFKKTVGPCLAGREKSRKIT